LEKIPTDGNLRGRLIVPACPTCGKQLDSTARFCPDDGTPVSEIAVGAATPSRIVTADEGLSLPTVLCGRYRLESFLGGGGMAKVYRAVDLTLEREVAVKVMNAELRKEPDFDARFQREARIASQLNNPYIVVVHDYGLDSANGPYLVMEYLRGHSLRERLQFEGPLPLRSSVRLGAQLFLALVHAHEKEIVHRDIKPDNIFILNQSSIGMQIRVLDFGIARMVHRSYLDHAETLTQPGAVVGTPRYMSPEQLAGQQLDARSDVYSAALVIYESMTGSLPFASQRRLAEACPESPAAIQELLNACLQSNPAERPPSALDVYRRLEAACRASGIMTLGPAGSDAPPQAADPDAPTLVVPARRTRIRRRLLLAAGAAAFLGLSTWAVLAFFPFSSGSPASKETLLGISLGDGRDDLVAKFGKPERHWTGSPWQEKPEVLGLVLRPEDLLADETWQGYESITWSKDQICAVLKEGAVQALVVRQPSRAENGRGLRVGDDESKLERLYSEKPEIGTADAPPSIAKGSRKSANWIKVYRYTTLGTGFEVRDEKVRSMTLFPLQPD
jgi:tRNA A-37 threonylcarbamoyl transferase component Bud32